jgi:hypothetical protein
MTRPAPPAFATRLLALFMGPGNQALVGDLLEQYSEGRSRWWFWRQVVAAVAQSALVNAREHPISSLGGVLAGCITLYAFGAVGSVLRTQLTVGSLINFKLWWWQHSGPSLGWPLGIAWFTVGSIVSGWIVARTHDTRWAGTVVLFLATYFVIELGLVGWMAIRVYRDPHVYVFWERTRLIGELTMLFVVWPTFIVLGALIRARRADEPHIA